MKCPHCFSNVTESMKNCPSCGCEILPSTVQEFSKPSNKPSISQIQKKPIIIAGIIATIAIIIFLGPTIKFRFIDGYKIEAYGMTDSCQIKYAGDLYQLYSRDKIMLYSVMHWERFEGNLINHIQCDDYTVTYNTSGPSVDILEDNITLYKPGLVEYPRPSAGSSYQRFHKDWVIVIEHLKSGHKYYFCSFSDVEDWIASYA